MSEPEFDPILAIQYEIDRSLIIERFGRDPDDLSPKDEWMIPTVIGIARELQRSPEGLNEIAPLQLEPNSRRDPFGYPDGSRLLTILLDSISAVNFEFERANDVQYGHTKRQEILDHVKSVSEKIRTEFAKVGTSPNFYNMSVGYAALIELAGEFETTPDEFITSYPSDFSFAIKHLNLGNLN